VLIPTLSFSPNPFWLVVLLCARYDMDTAMDEWEEEEDDERVRQLFVRWACMEYDMPEGYECPERVVYNRETVRLGHLTRQAQEHARKTREDVTDRLLACLTAASFTTICSAATSCHGRTMEWQR